MIVTIAVSVVIDWWFHSEIQAYTENRYSKGDDRQKWEASRPIFGTISTFVSSFWHWSKDGKQDHQRRNVETQNEADG
jgi:hypothetical protein